MNKQLLQELNALKSVKEVNSVNLGQKDRETIAHQEDRDQGNQRYDLPNRYLVTNLNE